MKAKIYKGGEEKLPFTCKWMSVRDLARRWRISLSSVYNLKAGVQLLTRYRFGSSIRFLTEEVIEVEQTIQRRGVKAISKGERYVK